MSGPTSFRTLSRRVFTRLTLLSMGLFLLLYEAANAQKSPENLRNSLRDDVFVIVEKAPEFPGGFPALRDYLIAQVNYPAEARKAGVTGRVYVSFIVE